MTVVMTGYLPRSLGPAVREALAAMPVVVITGLRQSGKSTFLLQEKGLGRRRYVSLDDFAHLEAARRDPEGLARSEEPLAVDEFQKCPDLLTAIERVVDDARVPGRFLLAGSADPGLLRDVTESLAGRAVHLTLHPLTRREIGRRGGKVPFLRRAFEEGRPPRPGRVEAVRPEDVQLGGLPPVRLGQTRRPDPWYRGYEQTYVEKDLRDFSRIGDLVSFRALLRRAALRTAQVLAVSDLGRDAKLGADTTTRYLGLLEASFVVRRLQPSLANRASRLIKSPKLYLADSGLAAHLAGADYAALPPGDPLRGALLETYAAQNLLGILESEWPEARLTYWHVQGRHEVDFVVEVGRDTLAVEVKGTPRWVDRDLAGLRAFLRHTPRCRLAILACGARETVRLGDRLWAAPLGAVLS
jgi:predicted AAA+ superfamily ATPase